MLQKKGRDKTKSSFSPVAMWVEKSLATLAMACHRRPWRCLVMAFCLSFASLYAASGLKLNADLGALIPENFQSIKDLRKLSERFGGSGYVYVVARHAPAETLKTLASDLAPKLQALASIEFVDYQREHEFFEDRALYFLSLDDLEDVEKRIQDRVDWERQKFNPLFFDLGGDPPSLSFSELKEKTLGSSRGWLKTQRGERYYIDAEEQIVILKAKPALASLDLKQTRLMLGDIENVLHTMDLQYYAPNLEIILQGRFKSRIQLQDMLEKDLAAVSLVSASAIVVYLMFHFQHILAVLLILGPLLLGLAWCFGLAAITFGQLNILTAFIGIILLGLGIDHGIHLLGRYNSCHHQLKDPHKAIAETFAQTGRAVTVAALTTLVALLALAVSQFRAFREFGLIAAAGMALVLLGYTTVLPALLRLLSDWGWVPKNPNTFSLSPWAKWSHAHAKFVAGVSLTGLLLTLLLAPPLLFNYDLSSMEATSAEEHAINAHIRRILGFGDGAVSILSDSLKDERDAVKALRKIKQSTPNSAIDMIAASTDLVPQQQEQKEIILERIKTLLGSIDSQNVKTKDDQNNLASLKRLVNAAPFSRQDLPRQAKILFGRNTNTSSEESGFALVFSNVRSGNGLRVVEYADELRQLKLPDGRVPPIAGDDLVLADIFNTVKQEAPQVAILTIVSIILTLWLLLGRFGQIFLCLIPPIATLCLTWALLPLMGIKLNYINIVIFPVLFGLGVDGAVHLLTRLDRGDDYQDTLSETGRSIAGAILTTALGFGALLLAQHLGLNSLGLVAVVGLGVNLLICLVLFPALLACLPSQRS
jgi:uncharacterized protein